MIIVRRSRRTGRAMLKVRGGRSRWRREVREGGPRLCRGTIALRAELLDRIRANGKQKLEEEVLRERSR